MKPPGSNRLWSKLNRIRICLRRSCWNSVNRKALFFWPLGHGIRPGPLEDPAVLAIARQTTLTPAQVLLAWGIQRGTAVLTTAKTLDRARENYNISEIPEAAVDEISRIQIRSRLNSVVATGVPGFIARGG